MLVVSYFSVFVIMIEACFSARILGVFLTPSSGHQVFSQELSLRGHQVVVVTPDAIKNPDLINLTEIEVDFSNLSKHNYLHRGKFDIKSKIAYTKENLQCLEAMAEQIFGNPNVMRIYNNSEENFDLVITEYTHPILHAFGLLYNAPVIGLLNKDAPTSSYSVMGNPIHPIFGNSLVSNSKKSILEKFLYSFYYIWYKWYYNNVVHSRSNKIIRKYFRNELPLLAEAEANTSMMFINTNIFLHPNIPLAPTVMSLGFMHIRPVQFLPKDLQSVLDQAIRGAVYVSLGSNVKSSTLSPEIINIFLKTFAELPYTILWKWETDDTPKIGKNTITRKWFPQQDILAHPNVKVFVTQGGLQSIEESIARAVPMVGIPFIADQEMNVNQLVEHGIAIKIEQETLSKDKLRDAILNVAQSSEYSEKIKNVRDIVLDQPMTGLEKAVWWTEYVIRHKGARHLRSVIADTPLWEYLMLDVIAAVLVFLILSFFILYKILGLIIKKIKSFGINKVKSD